MAHADINTILTGLALVDLTQAITDDFQDDVMYELSRGAFPGLLVQTGASYVAVTGGTERYTLPTASNARTLLALFYDQTHLFQLRKDEAWAANAEWRDDPEPVVSGFIQDPEDRSSFSLVPPPKYDGETVGAATPFNGTWVEGNITAIYAEGDTAFGGATYIDLKMPIAFEVLAREFARDSDHQDKTAADVAHNMAELLFLMSNPVGRSW